MGPESLILANLLRSRAPGSSINMILMKQERKGTWLEDWTSREQTGSLSRTPTPHLWMCVGYSKGTCVVDLKPKQECWLNKRTETNNAFCIGAQTKVPSSGVQVLWELGFNWHASRITQGCSKHKGFQLRLVVTSWEHLEMCKGVSGWLIDL